jgi:hypothetical protein
LCGRRRGLSDDFAVIDKEAAGLDAVGGGVLVWGSGG